MSLPIPVAAEQAPAPIDSPDPALRFVVGQDPQGRRVAVEIHGLGGGLFRTRHDALHCTDDATHRRPDAVTVPTGRVEFRIALRSRSHHTALGTHRTGS